MTVNFYSGSYSYTPTQYGTRTATRRVPYTATRQVPYQEEESYISNSKPKVYYLNALLVSWIIENGVRKTNVRNYKSKPFSGVNDPGTYFVSLKRSGEIPSSSTLVQQPIDETTKSPISSTGRYDVIIHGNITPDLFHITIEWGSPIYSTRTVTKYRTESYTEYRTESYQESYVISNAYSSVSCTGLSTSGTTGLINSSYTGRVLVSTDGANYTYYSGTSLNNLLTTSSIPVYTAILSESGSTLGLTNGSSYTKSTIESKVAEYNAAQGISNVREELEPTRTYLNTISTTGLEEVKVRYETIYGAGVNNYTLVKAILAKAYM